MEGITRRPVIDHSKCAPCSICLGGCPAESLTEMRSEPKSLRGMAYQAMTEKVGPQAESDAPLPPCRQSCPLNQDIPGYIKLIAQKCFDEAIKLIRETNPLPSVCGLICHRPCETSCMRAYVDKPVAIRSLKSFAASYDRPAPSYLSKKKSNGVRITIIGSGPAGLSAAFELAKNGCQVEIIEAHDQPGGMLSWAIPDFRLPKNILRKDIDYIQSMGVNIRAGIRFGRDITLDDLKNEGAEAVIIAAGTMKSVRMNIENEKNHAGYFDCLTLFQKIAGRRDVSLGKKTLVVGGGNAALDTARTALRLGTENAEILYRRSPEEMPADREEIKAALDEGVQIRFLTAPIKMTASDGKLTGLQCVKTELIDAEGSKRRVPVVIAGSEFTLNADVVISAIGQTADYIEIVRGLAPDFGLEKFPRFKGSMLGGFEGVFGAGDFINGSTSVVEAIASGRKAAGEAWRYLRDKNKKREVVEKS